MEDIIEKIKEYKLFLALTAIGAQLIDTWLFDGSFDIDRNDFGCIRHRSRRLFFFGTSGLHLFFARS